MAQEALKARDSKLALQIAGGLLEANPKGVYPYFIMAQAYGQLDQYDKGQLAAARAYKNATTDKERFAAADLAARMSYAGKRPTKAQLWLRRAAQNAPSEQAEDQLSKDYARVRRENPFSFHISGGIRPSSNVNNGSSHDVHTFEGNTGLRGRLNGLAVALDGWVGHVSSSLSYKLHRSQKSETVLRSSLYVSRVALSSDSLEELKRAARIHGVATKGNRDLGLTYATIGIDHSFSIGDKGLGSVGIEFGQLWSGGDHYYASTRLKAARKWKINESGILTVTASFEVRDVKDHVNNDANIWELNAQYGQSLSNGDYASIALSFGETFSRSNLKKAERIAITGRYGFGKQFGPVKLTMGLSLGINDYDEYLFATIPAPRRPGDPPRRRPPIGRMDRSIAADVSMFFPDYDYMGFAPTVTIKATQKFSNYTRFETKELSVGLGLQSKF